jgi:hypothetical protein
VGGEGDRILNVCKIILNKYSQAISVSEFRWEFLYKSKPSGDFRTSDIQYGDINSSFGSVIENFGTLRLTQPVGNRNIVSLTTTDIKCAHIDIPVVRVVSPNNAIPVTLRVAISALKVG